MSHHKLDVHAVELVVEAAKEVLEEKELIESGHHKHIERSLCCCEILPFLPLSC